MLLQCKHQVRWMKWAGWSKLLPLMAWYVLSDERVGVL